MTTSRETSAPKPPSPSQEATLPPSPDPDATRYTDEPAAAAPPALPSIPGYEILAVLGRGAFGVVYKARHLALQRVVALKMILAAEHADEYERQRFRAEAEAVARLHQPHIVQIHEVGEHDGRPFLSLEYCAGGSLDKKLAGTPLPPLDAARLVETLARAVHAAHLQKVVHRDLKPSNVLLTEDGQPKVADFGLAKRLDEAGQTASGAVLGTPSYMAPEQAGGKGKEVGPAADVYALGAMLYECLTGRPPFRAATAMDTMLQVISDDPVPPRQLQSKTPGDLETICLKCLTKEPARRYASAEELANDLRRFQAGEPIRARPVRAVERALKWVRRHAAISALAAAVLLATALGAAGVVWKYLDAEQQKGVAQGKEKEARQEADKARKARDFLVSIFAIKDVRAGNTTTARQILNQAELRIPIEFADQPELRDELLAAIGEVNRRLDRTIPAAMMLEARGAVALHSPRDDGAQPKPQTLLYPDDRLTLGADARVQLVFLSDLHKERLQPGREATIGRKGCSPADAVRDRDDSVLMTFVRLPKGTFYMGWGEDDGKGGLIDKGVKTEIKEDFEIAAHDVTQGQWEAIMGSNPSCFSRKGNSRNDVVDISDEELKLFPVENVSWDDAQEFLKKVNEKEAGRGYLYRLPTGAEWEYACRNGASSEEECSHHFYLDQPTDDLSSQQANFDGSLPFGKAPKGPFLGRTTRVGAYPPNKLGLYDMLGNVWQWTDTAEGSSRVIRGGGWGDGAGHCRVAFRYLDGPGVRFDALGFRLARVPSGSK